MPNLASKQEGIEYGSLGYRFECPEIISQCKVIYDDLNPMSQGIDDKDIIRLYQIKEKLINIMRECELIIELNET